MNFVAKYINEIKAQSSMTAELLLEIALQRVLRGTVIVPSPMSNWSKLLNKLPQKYSYYSSFWDEEHIMTNGCYNFIMTALENGLDNAKTSKLSERSDLKILRASARLWPTRLYNFRIAAAVKYFVPNANRLQPTKLSFFLSLVLILYTIALFCK